MQSTEHEIPADGQRLALAYVEDSHNIGCLVRFAGAEAAQRAHFSDAIQQHGVVIRTGHVVLADRNRDPVEVVWRVGTLGTVEAVDAGQLTVNLGYRQVSLPLRDERTEAERTRPIAVGDRVLLRGSPIEQAAVSDVVVGGELAHPERLRATVEQALNHRARQGEGQP